MDPYERNKLAAERAEHYAPRPTGGAIMAGLCGAAMALLADVSASKFYAWPLAGHVPATVLVVIFGFIVVLVGYRRAARRNRHAQLKELGQINRDEGRPPSS